MKAKLILIGSISETHVASFKAISEAFHCGSLLEASLPDDCTSQYYVEFRENNRLVRRAVDSLTRRLAFLNEHYQQELTQYYKTRTQILAQ